MSDAPAIESEGYLRGLRNALEAMQANRLDLDDPPDNDEARGYLVAVCNGVDAIERLIASAEQESSK